MADAATLPGVRPAHPSRRRMSGAPHEQADPGGGLHGTRRSDRRSRPSGRGRATHHPSAARLSVSGLQGTIGGTIGPDGALYVPEAVLGRITRVDPRSAATSTFADGLPKQVIPLGGVMDVAFVGRTAYALVTLVSPDVGGTSIDGIYRIDGRHHATVIADIGAWSMAHPPKTEFQVPTGLQYAAPARAGRLPGLRRPPQPRAEGHQQG